MVVRISVDASHLSSNSLEPDASAVGTPLPPATAIRWIRSVGDEFGI